MWAILALDLSADTALFKLRESHHYQTSGGMYMKLSEGTAADKSRADTAHVFHSEHTDHTPTGRRRIRRRLPRTLWQAGIFIYPRAVSVRVKMVYRPTKLRIISPDKEIIWIMLDKFNYSQKFTIIAVGVGDGKLFPSSPNTTPKAVLRSIRSQSL